MTEKKKPGRPRKPANPAPSEVEVFLYAGKATVPLDGDTAEVPVRGHIRFRNVMAGLEFGPPPPEAFYQADGSVLHPKTEHPVTLTIPASLIKALCKAPGIDPPFTPPTASE